MPSYSIKPSIKELTPQERLWMWRNNAGLTLDEAAAHYGWSSTKYRNYEEGYVDIPSHVELPPIEDWPMPLVLRFIRKRNGKGLRETAKRMKMSHVTLLNREKAADPDLIRNWRVRGYDV